MAAITVLASGTVSGSDSSSPLDTSSYATAKISISALPTKADPAARIHVFVESARSSAGPWHLLSETVLAYGRSTGAEAFPPSGQVDLAPVCTDAVLRARWLIEDPGSWTLAVTGTAA